MFLPYRDQHGTWGSRLRLGLFLAGSWPAMASFDTLTDGGLGWRWLGRLTSPATSRPFVRFRFPPIGVRLFSLYGYRVLATEASISVRSAVCAVASSSSLRGCFILGSGCPRRDFAARLGPLLKLGGRAPADSFFDAPSKSARLAWRISLPSVKEETVQSATMEQLYKAFREKLSEGGVKSGGGPDGESIEEGAQTSAEQLPNRKGAIPRNESFRMGGSCLWRKSGGDNPLVAPDGASRRG